MPHRRHRVRVHVHNRYVRTQEPEQNSSCKKRCRNGSRCRSRRRRNDDNLYRLDDTYDRPPDDLGGSRQDQRGCRRFLSAEEVCRPRCGGAGGQTADGAPYEAAEDGRQGGYESGGGGGPCNGCGRNRAASGGCGCKGGRSPRPGTPCERFKSAEETCRPCSRRPGQRQPRQDGGEQYQDAGRGGPNTSYNVYTAQVQQRGFTGENQFFQQRQTPGRPQPVRQPTNAQPCPNSDITEEIVHTREHRWHIPSAQRPTTPDRGLPVPPGSVQQETDPPDGRWTTERRGPGWSDGSHRSAAQSPVPAGESSSDSGRRRSAPVAGVRRTRSELLAGREMVARIARQVELDDGTRAEHQLVYRLSAQYDAQLGDSDSRWDSGSEDGPRPPMSEPGTERTSQTARTGQTVLRLERLRLEDDTDSSGSSDYSPRPAPRSARPAEPPSPLPRRQVASEPTLPAPPVPALTPATRVARSLDCQPGPVSGGRTRTRRLRTRGALTRLRQRSVTRLNEERQRQLLTEPLVTPTNRQTVGKPPPNQPSDTEDGGRLDVTVLHAQNLLPADYRGPGFRGDAADEPVYHNIDTLYDGAAAKPGGSPGYSSGGAFSPVQPASQALYQSRVGDPNQPDPSQYRNYGEYGGRQSPYLATSPSGRSARARFDDDDQLGAALYEQRYQPRRDNSPYLSRPTDRPVPAPGTDIRAGKGAPLQRQGGQQRLGAGRRAVGLGQRLSRGFSSLRQRGAALYRRLSGGRARGAAGRGRGRGRASPARPATARTRRRSSCSCTDSDSDCGAVNCSFLFYFNGDGGPSPFMSNMPAAITETGSSQRGTGTMSKKYCGMCD